MATIDKFCKVVWTACTLHHYVQGIAKDFKRKFAMVHGINIKQGSKGAPHMLMNHIIMHVHFKVQQI